MAKITKEDWTMIICAIVLLITTIYLYPKLYGWEKVAWGIWGAAIFIGTMASDKKEKRIKRK